MSGYAAEVPCGLPYSMLHRVTVEGSQLTNRRRQQHEQEQAREHQSQAPPPGELIAKRQCNFQSGYSFELIHGWDFLAWN